jgi:hypothetical protein
VKSSGDSAVDPGSLGLVIVKVKVVVAPAVIVGLAKAALRGAVGKVMAHHHWSSPPIAGLTLLKLAL